jgi:ribosome-associated toxin RatA of RatAB toxin-antitoxin module
VAEIRCTRTIAAEPQRIWGVLADFGAVSAWAEFVDHSCLLSPAAEGIGVGTSRRVQLGRATFVERITDFDPPNALSYDIEGLPRLVRHLRSSWTLRPLARGYTEVTLTSTVDIGSNPVQKLAERIFGRVSAKQLDLLFSGLTKRVEGSHV